MDDPQEQLDNCQRKAAAFYEAVRRQHKNLNLPFAGEPSANGSPPVVSAGAILLPSRTEMADLGQLITLVLSSWIQSREMPSVGQLHSSAESSEVDQVVFITTLYSTAMIGAFLARIGTGDLDTVSSILDHLSQAKEEPGTSLGTSLRTRRRLAGLSTPTIPPDPELEAEDAQLAGRESLATHGTSNGGSKRKKKSYKSKARRKKQRSTNK